MNKTALFLGLSQTRRLWTCITNGSIGLRTLLNTSSLRLSLFSPSGETGLSIFDVLVLIPTCQQTGAIIFVLEMT